MGRICLTPARPASAAIGGRCPSVAALASRPPPTLGAPQINPLCARACRAAAMLAAALQALAQRGERSNLF